MSKLFSYDTIISSNEWSVTNWPDTGGIAKSVRQNKQWNSSVCNKKNWESLWTTNLKNKTERE